MALPGITSFTVVDGSLGLLPEEFTGVRLVIGPASGGTVNQIYSFSNAQDAKTVFQGGRLLNALSIGLDIKGPPLYAMRINTSVAGTVGTQIVTLQTGSDGVLATTGSSPLEDNDVVITITRAGKVGTSPYPAFTYSLDAGVTVSDEISVPVAGTYVIPFTGITLVFSNGGTGFKVGDVWKFKTTAAQWNNTDLSNALAAALADNTKNYEFIHVIGPVDATLASTAASYATLAETNERYIHIILETRDMNYIATLATAAQTFPMTFTGGETLKILVSTDGGLTFPTTKTFTFPATTYANIAALVTALNIQSFTGGIFTPVNTTGTVLGLVFVSNKGKVQLKVDGTSTGIGALLVNYTAAQTALGELEDDWMNVLATTFIAFVSPRVEIVAGHADMFSSIAKRYVRESGAYLVAARTSLVPISEDLGAVERGPLPLLLTPDVAAGRYGIYHDEDAKYGLDPQRFTTLRRIKGLPGFYITQGRTMASVGSDFTFIQYRRVIDRASFLLSVISKKFINKRVRVNADGTLYITDRKNIEDEVRSYIASGLQGEIVDLTVVVDPTVNVLSTQQLKITVSIRPYGYTKYIQLKIGYAPVQAITIV